MKRKQPITAWMIVNKDGSPVGGSVSGAIYDEHDRAAALKSLNRPAGQRIVPIEIRDLTKSPERKLLEAAKPVSVVKIAPRRNSRFIARINPTTNDNL